MSKARAIYRLLVWAAILGALTSVSASSNIVAERVNRELLQTIKSYMDFEENPCDDFYQYSCGNWEYVHWDERKYVDTIGSIEYAMNVEAAQLLERITATERGRKNAVYRKLSDYYTACRRTPKNDVNAMLQLLPPVGARDWPTSGVAWQQDVDGNVVDTFDGIATLGLLRAYGLNDVLLHEELKNRHNATDYVIYIDKPSSAEWSADGSERQQLRMLQQSPHFKDNSAAEKLQALHQKLQQLQMRYRDERAPQWMTLQQLRHKVPGLQLERYLTQLLQAPPSATQPLLVGNIAYLRRLVELLARTSPQTLAHYLRLKLRTHLQQQLPRNNSVPHCMQHLRQQLPLAVDYMWEREVYAPHRNATDAVIRGVFANMQTRFEQLLTDHAAQFSSEQLHFLRQKIRRMRLNIGNLPRDVSDDFYDEYFSALNVHNANFAASLLSALQHQPAREHQLLRLHTLGPMHTFFTWRHASPAYLQSANILLIPFAYLRPPIFERHYHELFLYAELGNTLGHELMHGFDTSGLMYDAWGTPSALFAETLQHNPHFQRSLHCLQREATSSLNEKLADFSGFRLAYEAYFAREQVPKFRGERVLTNKQLFYIKFAQFFCATSANRIRYDDSHDTPFQRVPQVVANYGDFAQEFGCKANSRMSPTEQCNMW